MAPPPTGSEKFESFEVTEMIKHLLQNTEVTFGHQQRGETELSETDKVELATKLFNSNKNNFLVKFGTHLTMKQLHQFACFCNETDQGLEIKSTLERLMTNFDDERKLKLIKNRRYQALQEMLQTAYFSESDMMKRAPLLYSELVGQYLTEDERRERNKATEQETLVQILMEGIERDDARELRRKQVENEENAMEEEDDSSDESTSLANVVKDEEVPQPGPSRWGEFEDLQEKAIGKDEFYGVDSKTTHIGSKQKALLKEEFMSLMYQSFLDGKDEFDYNTVDNNEKYDNLEILTQDEEDKYFDSEEPTTMDVEVNNSGPSSEDELEIFMHRLQSSHPAVLQLSDDFKRL